MKTLTAALLLFGTAVAARPAPQVNDAAITADGYPARLSDYGFFADLARRTPAPRVAPYGLETPLFSDYAEKQRFLYVPGGARARYDGDKAFAFPVGSALIKTFGYTQAGSFRPLETRLLLHRASGWVALPYVWNAEGSDALLRRAGTRLQVSFTDPSGAARSISYAVPNQNQCKDCHALDGAIAPIGPKARYLNHDGQLQHLVAAGLLDHAPADAPRVARWDDPAAPLDARARAYLEINCAHCHNPLGAASNSGLFLGIDQKDPIALGIGKRPVAAGRGSGDRDFAIQPGDPDASILVYRMESTDPGIAMPELGRATVHAEGVALLRQWIGAMPKAGAAAPAPAPAPTPAAHKWQPLFDGRSLAGWTPKITGHAFGEDPRRTFIVRGGTIRVSYAHYPRFDGQFGHLFWKNPLSAYRLRLEYRFTGKSLTDIADWQHSNSGLMMLSQDPRTMARDQKFPVSLEVQLLGAERPEPSPTGNVCTPGTNIHIDGRLETKHCILSTSPIIPNGRWVKAEVEVRRDGTITHFIDGKPVLRYAAPELDPTDADAKPLIAAAGGALAVSRGWIALQSEGHPIEFRNIALLPLD